MTTHIPSVLLEEIDQLVAQGAFPTRDAAVEQLLRLGLDAFRGRRERGGPGRPPMPPSPPLNRDPHDDEPISVDPTRPQFI